MTLIAQGLSGRVVQVSCLFHLFGVDARRRNDESIYRAGREPFFFEIRGVADVFDGDLGVHVAHIRLTPLDVECALTLQPLRDNVVVILALHYLVDVEAAHIGHVAVQAFEVVAALMDGDGVDDAVPLD